jgi:hypothetical protein
MTKFELYNVLCSINDIVLEEQYGPETKIKEIEKLLNWTFPQIDPEMMEKDIDI